MIRVEGGRQETKLDCFDRNHFFGKDTSGNVTFEKKIRSEIELLHKNLPREKIFFFKVYLKYSN